jgi:creatinine amidohydrolase/Fe(II)-dependent formamide hydrolase-like protein
MLVRSRTLCLIACCLVAAAALGAQPVNRVWLDDYTWTELATAVNAGKTTIIVPIGGTEQNGPHMALGKHNVRVKILAERIAQTLGNALVAPVIAYVPEGDIEPPTSHMRFPGTISVPERTFQSVLESAARSFKRHGFRDIVFIGDHSGYQKSEQAVAARLNREWAASPVRVHAIVAFYEVTQSRYRDLLRRRGFTDEEIGTHAGVADTSLTLAIDPSLVREDRLQSAAAEGQKSGVHGDPRRSSAELGGLGIDVIVTETVNEIRNAVKRR